MKYCGRGKKRKQCPAVIICSLEIIWNCSFKWVNTPVGLALLLRWIHSLGRTGWEHSACSQILFNQYANYLNWETEIGWREFDSLCCYILVMTCCRSSHTNVCACTRQTEIKRDEKRFECRLSVGYLSIAILLIWGKNADRFHLLPVKCVYFSLCFRFSWALSPALFLPLSICH